jgi:hypothetical protein
MTDTFAPDFTRTRLNTLSYLIDKQLLDLKDYVNTNQVIPVPTRVFIGNRLVTLGHVVEMAGEISDALEPALRGIARTVQHLTDAGHMNKACAETIFASYNAHLGDQAADQLLADALAALDA